MTNTIKALDQFTQALGLLLPPPALTPTTPRHPEPVQAATPAAPVRPAAAQGQPAAMSRDGITRRAPRGDWAQWARLAVLALSMALGFSRAVRATARAADSYCRQAVAKSLAVQHHGDPTRPVRPTPGAGRRAGG